MQLRPCDLVVKLALAAAFLAVVILEYGQATTVAAIEELGGSVVYDHEFVENGFARMFLDADRVEGTPWEGRLVVSLIGPDWFHRVWGVYLRPRESVRGLQLVRSLGSVRRLHLGGATITPEIRTLLEAMPTLEEVRGYSSEFAGISRQEFEDRMRERGVATGL